MFANSNNNNNSGNSSNSNNSDNKRNNIIGSGNNDSNSDNHSRQLWHEQLGTTFPMTGAMANSNRIAPQFSSYDVLLMPLPPSIDDSPIRFAPGNHIGNQRFQVLLSIYRERFIQAARRGDENECFKIVYEIIETVSHKCVPNGRFFEQCWGQQWREIGLGPSTVQLVRSALMTPPLGSSTYFSSSQDDYWDNNKNNESSFLKKEVNEEVGQKRPCHRPSGFMMLCTAAKKSEEFVASPDPFDVLCDTSGLTAQSGSHVGNKRLIDLIDSRSSSYEVADQEGRKKIVNEIISSIIDDTPGRFLQLDRTASAYKTMNKETAMACVSNILNASAMINKEGRAKLLRASAVKSLKERKIKKAVLDKIADRKSGETPFTDSPPPITFKSQHQSPSDHKNEFAPRAA